MAHEQNQSVTAAASLFGGESAGNDFFSSLQEEPQTVSSHDDLFTSTSSNGGDSADASALFGSDNSGGQELWDDVTSREGADHHSNAHTWTQDTGTTTVDDPYASQGWYDQYGQWNAYENGTAQQEWTSSDYDSSANTATDTPAYNPSAYDYSYNGYAAVDSVPQSTAENYGYQAYQPSYAGSSGTSNPTTTPYSAYSQPQSAYDPYRPATTSQIRSPAKPVEPPKPAYSYETPPPQPSIIKQESAEAYRPKTYSAYDPPVLEKRPRKQVSRPPPQASTPYSAYDQTQAHNYTTAAHPPSAPSYAYGQYDQPVTPSVNPHYAGAYGMNMGDAYAPSQAPLTSAVGSSPSHTYHQPNGHAQAPNSPYANNTYVPQVSNTWPSAPALDHGYVPPPQHDLQSSHYGAEAHYHPEQAPPTSSPYSGGPYTQATTDDDFYGSESQGDFYYGPNDTVDLGEETGVPSLASYTPAAPPGVAGKDNAATAARPDTDDWFDQPQGDEPDYAMESYSKPSPPSATVPTSISQGTSSTSPVYSGSSPYSYPYQPTATQLSPTLPPNGHPPLGPDSLAAPGGQTNAFTSPPVRNGPPPRAKSPAVSISKSGGTSSDVVSGHGRRVSLTTRSRAASPAVAAMNSGIRSHTSSPVIPRSQTSSPFVANAAAHLEAARHKIASPETSFKTHGALPPPSPISNHATLASSAYDPYKPTTAATYAPPLVAQTSLPAEVEPSSEADGSYNPYAPPPISRHHSQKLSDGSQNGGYQPSDPYSPYNPTSTHSKPPSVDFKYPSASYSPETPYNPMTTRNTQIPDQAVPHFATAAAYVPSASTSASDDFLGRAGARVPLITFGFGGKIVTCFHTQFDITSGFDISLAPKKSSPIILRTLNQLVTDSVLDTTSTSFPGPLFSDPGIPSVNLARSTASTAKAKKALVVKYLEERVSEIQSGLGYSSGLSKSKMENKLALVRVLKVMVEYDGQVSGSAEVDALVRSALLPRLANANVDSQMAPFGFTAPAIDAMTNSNNHLHEKSRSTVSAVSYQVQPSSIDKIQELILQGERRKAYQYALDAKLWAHAMVISSSLDKEAWKESVSEFIKFELGVDASNHSGEGTNGRESLRVVYSMFAGHGASAVQELYPPKSLASRASQGVPAFGQPSTFSASQPAHFGPSSSHADLPMSSLSKWAETAAMIASNPAVGDLTALSALGDSLASSQWTEAAHVCYLLSLASSPIGGVTTPSAKMVLVGSESPNLKTAFHADPDAIIFSEILEFALSLIPVAKGQEPYGGLPHLQAYRLVRATQLAEMGHLVLANRYCEAVGGTLRLNKPSAYYTTTFLTQLKELSDRLLGAPMLDKSGSWIARKMTKPSLDTIGSWLEGRFTKFIAGEGEEEKQTKKTEIGSSELTPAGPFAQYSVISSANTSPNASTINLSLSGGLVPPSSAPPKRSGSAAALRPPAFTLIPGPTDRSASAMDHRPAPRLSSPAPQAQSANAATTSFYQVGSPYGVPSRSRSGTIEEDSSTESLRNDEPRFENNTGPWWGSSTDADESAATPTAAAFHTLDAPTSDPSNFISPMDSTFAPTPSPHGSNISTPKTNPRSMMEDDDEDLGFGNNSNKKKKDKEPDDDEKNDETTGSAASKAGEPSKSKPAAEGKPASSGSWFPRLWGRKEESTPAPVKANLGDETTFYYDKELKRWVNKKAGSDANAAPAALPPPPSRTPSRAQTASPGASTLAPPTATSGPPKSATPPPRPATTTLAPPSRTSTAPPKRSQLAESFVPNTDAGDGEHSAPLPPSRPGSAFSPPDGPTPPPSRGSNIRRKGKSRYVDVFAQEQNGGT